MAAGTSQYSPILLKTALALHGEAQQRTQRRVVPSPIPLQLGLRVCRLVALPVLNNLHNIPNLPQAGVHASGHSGRHAMRSADLHGRIGGAAVIGGAPRTTPPGRRGASAPPGG